MALNRLRLGYRPPYDWDAILAFLAARATPGVEAVDAFGYQRTIALDGMQGSIAVSHGAQGGALDLEVRFPDPAALPVIEERVRRIFDLGCDPSVIAAHLGVDPLLRTPLRKHPGIRQPGAWDGFELAVRAIVGQQISVRGATTIAGRIASMFGSPFQAPHEGAPYDRLFPTATQLADAPIEDAGVIARRAGAIRTLAARVVDGTITFEGPTDRPSALAALQLIPGIGAWTAQYIAMRAFGDPDAFMSGDLILQRMACPEPGALKPTPSRRARELDRRAESWRPWRSYAVMLLWQHANDAKAANPRAV